MELPSILQGESVTRLLQGAIAGFLATTVIGFNWGGWMLDSTARQMAEKSANSAVVTVLAPLCADRFRAASDLDAQYGRAEEGQLVDAGFLHREGRLGDLLRRNRTRARRRPSVREPAHRSEISAARQADGLLPAMARSGALWLLRFNPLDRETLMPDPDWNSTVAAAPDARGRDGCSPVIRRSEPGAQRRPGDRQYHGCSPRPGLGADVGDAGRASACWLSPVARLPGRRPAGAAVHDPARLRPRRVLPPPSRQRLGRASCSGCWRSRPMISGAAPMRFTIRPRR